LTTLTKEPIFNIVKGTSILGDVIVFRVIRASLNGGPKMSCCRGDTRRDFEIIPTKHYAKASYFLPRLLVVFLTLLPGRSLHSQELSENADQVKLKKVLETAGEYCEKLKTMALNFICHENIKEKTYEFNKTILFRRSPDKPPRFVAVDDLRTARTIKNSYGYDYQMIKKGDVFKENRDLIEENGKKRNAKDVELQTLRMSAKYPVFGPVGFLSKSWQPHFQYEIVGAETIRHQRAIVIRAMPREITEENHCCGRIWLDESDSSIFQIEWEPQSIVHFKETVESSMGELKRKISWTVTYDVVKNGVRFPGAQSIKEIYITKAGKEHIKYEAEYVYDKYKFFTVETEVIFE